MDGDALVKIVLAVIAAGTTILAAWPTTPWGKKQTEAKADVSEGVTARGAFIDDASDVVKLYRDSLADLREENGRLRTELAAAASEVHALREASAELRDTVSALRSEVAALKVQLGTS